MKEFETFPPEIHPANYVMKGNNSHKQLTDINIIDEETLAHLDTMDANALRKLIQRVSGAMWGVGLKTREQVAEAFKLKLAISGMAEKDMFKALPIMREWFDREIGKATQHTTLDARVLAQVTHTERIVEADKEAEAMLLAISQRMATTSSNEDTDKQ